MKNSTLMKNILEEIDLMQTLPLSHEQTSYSQVSIKQAGSFNRDLRVLC